MLVTLHLTQCDESGWWVATVPEVGAVTQGPTRDAAKRRAEEAARAALEADVQLALVEEVAVGVI